MKTLNLHLPHLHMPRGGRSHGSHLRGLGDGDYRPPHERAPSYVWALLMTGLVALLLLGALWMSANNGFITAYAPSM